MDEIHRSFHASLPFVALATLADDGRVWASLACYDGSRGFVKAVDRNTLSIKIRQIPGDPLLENLSRARGEFGLLAKALRGHV